MVEPGGYSQRAVLPGGGVSSQWQLPADDLLGTRPYWAVLCASDYLLASDSEGSSVSTSVFRSNCLNCHVPIVRSQSCNELYLPNPLSSSVK